MSHQTAPRVFISYSHDSDEHALRVARLSASLRCDSIDVWLDQYEGGGPPEGWREWMQAQIEEADFVLMVCTEKYQDRSRKQADPGRGRGAIWELNLIYNEFQNENTVSGKFIPIVFEHADRRHVPAPFGDRNCYVLDDQVSYEQLYWVISEQTRGAPPLGPRKRRLLDDVEPLFDSPLHEESSTEDFSQRELRQRVHATAERRWPEATITRRAAASSSALWVYDVRQTKDGFPNDTLFAVFPDGLAQDAWRSFLSDVSSRFGSTIRSEYWM